MAREHENCPTCSCGRRAPVQGDRYVKGTQFVGKGPGTVAWSEHVKAWSEHVKAWSAYASVYGPSQSAERIAERGGFGFGELVALLGHEPATWLPRQEG